MYRFIFRNQKVARHVQSWWWTYMNLWLEKMSLVIYIHGDGVMATGYGLKWVLPWSWSWRWPGKVLQPLFRQAVPPPDRPERGFRQGHRDDVEFLRPLRRNSARITLLIIWDSSVINCTSQILQYYSRSKKSKQCHRPWGSCVASCLLAAASCYPSWSCI